MISQQQDGELGDSHWHQMVLRLGQVDIRKDTFKLFLFTLAVYSSYVATEWLFTHNKQCRQTVSTDQGRKRERVHWYWGVVKSECKFLYGYPKESTERMLQMPLKEKVLVEERGESQEPEGKNPTGRVCSANFRWLERSSGDGSGVIL